MTLNQRIHRAGQDLEPRWEERDVERVWQGLKRKRRRRVVAAAAGVAAVAGAAVWVLFAGAPRRDAVVATAARSETVRFSDGSTAVPSGGHETSLVVVEDTAARIVVNLAKGGARFDVVPRPDRTFAVRAGEVRVRVLGTAFSVERVADRVGVAVTRGTVEVNWGTGTRRLAVGDEGWFPPLVVSPSPDAGHAEDKVEDTVEDTGEHAVEKAPVRPRPKLGPPPAPAAAQPTAPAAPPAPDAAKLLADADRARLGGRFDDGAALLERLVREHPGDARAPLAAFSLGRLLLGELGRPAEAARAFARARALAPDGPLAREALAREAEAWARAGDSERARAREIEYRARTRSDVGQGP
jgi:transmembrane sensor